MLHLKHSQPTPYLFGSKKILSNRYPFSISSSSSSSSSAAMKDDVVFHSSMICLAAIILLMGVYTQSLQKMVATYFFGMFVICGVLLPDWDFFNRSVSQWCNPVTISDVASQSTHQKFSTSPTRFKVYPVRLVVYTSAYGFAFYKWWKFISN